MRNRFCRIGLFGALLLFSISRVSAQETPTYTNVQVVSIDNASRTLVVRNSKGQRESLMFDDLLASTGGIKPGDNVIMTVLGGPGRRRVSAMTLSRASAAPATTVVTRQVLSPNQIGAKEAFSRQVATISQDARGVDGSWGSFVTTCKVVQPESTSGGRDWFGLWVDGRVQADYTSGFCRDLFNQIVTSGEAIKKAMASAEEAVHGTLEPGEIRSIETMYNMNWDGWSLPAPARREP